MNLYLDNVFIIQLPAQTSFTIRNLGIGDTYTIKCVDAVDAVFQTQTIAPNNCGGYANLTFNP